MVRHFKFKNPLLLGIKMAGLLIIGGLFASYALANGMVNDADELRKAKRAYNKTNYEAALKYIRPLADRNNQEAQVLLANMYLWGLGLKRDPSKAAKWNLKAAIKGNVEAQYNLANQYLKADGVRYNRRKALRWFWESAVQGNLSAPSIMASIYESSQFRSESRFLANYLYCISALGRHDIALKHLERRGVSMGYCKRRAPSITRLAATHWPSALNSTPADSNESVDQRIKDKSEFKSEAVERLTQLANEAERKRQSEAGEQVLENDKYADRLLESELSERVEAERLEREAKAKEAERIAEEERCRQEQQMPIVRKIQSLLIETRYLADSADGVMGKKSLSALKSFYSDMDMKIPSEFSPQLVLDSMNRQLLESGKSCGLGGGNGDWAVCLSVTN